MSNTILKERGILAVCMKAGLRVTNGATPGWSYPVFALNGEPLNHVKRWKASNGGSPKYLWEPGGVEDLPQYYALPGLKEAIMAAGGTIHLAAGEPDVWTFHAAGLSNVLCWYGENNVPETLADDLKTLGVKVAYYYPDNDEPGMKAAAKVHYRLLDSGITCIIRQLPGSINEPNPAGFDANRLWQQIKFDASAFQALIQAADVILNFPPPPTPTAQPRPITGTNPDLIQLYEQWAMEVEQVAIARWQITPMNNRGYSKEHFRARPEDDNPSAQWNYQTHGYHDFGPNEDYSTHQVAEKLGLPPWEDYKKQHLPAPVRMSVPMEQAPVAPPRTPKGVKPARIISGKAQDQVIQKARTEGVKADGPVAYLNPYTPLRRFGGLWEMMEPGVIYLVIGVAGCGKTSLLETMIDGDVQDGRHILIHGPEWSPRLYRYRLYARWGGPSVNAQRYYDTWIKEEALGIPPEKRIGKALTSAELEQCDAIIQRASLWPGDVHYLDATGGVKQIVAEAERSFQMLTDQGIVLRAAYFDYVQKCSRGDNWTEMEHALNGLWEFCNRRQLVGIVCSQTNKDTANKLKRGAMLDQASGQLLSDQQAQAVMTINPDWRIDPTTKQEARYPYAWLRSVKNNLAPVPVRIKVKTALERHAYLDQMVEDDWETRDNDTKTNENGDDLLWYQQ